MMKQLRSRWGWMTLATAALSAVVVAVPTLGPKTQPLDPAVDTALASRTIAYFDVRWRQDPNNVTLAGRLADRYVRRFGTGADLRDLSRAEEIARHVTTVTAEDPVAHARLSVILLSQHKFSEAFDAARAAYDADRVNVSALGALFDAALAVGNYELAGRTLEQLPHRSLVRGLRVARWLGAMGDDAAASRRMHQACETIGSSRLRPQVHAWCLTELAAIVQGPYGTDSAEAILNRALDVQPGYRGAREALADLAYSRRHWRRAQNLYEAIAVDAHPDLYLRLAEVHRARGRHDRAREYEARFLTVAATPTNEALYAHPLATYYAERVEHRDLALEIITRDLARRRSIESYDVLSWVLFQRGELEDALAAAAMARQWGQPSPTMDYHLGLILRGLDRDMADEHLGRAVRDRSQLEPHALQHLAANPNFHRVAGR